MSNGFSKTYVHPPKHGFGLYYDPIYSAILLSPTNQRALDLSLMQRLRRIKQLSTLYLVYPGATHSRFEHSVGLSYLADKVFDVLFKKKYKFHKDDWPPLIPSIHKIALELAAIFHDIGHGPWSHVFELFCELKEDYRKLNHRKITEEWISGASGNREIPEFINREKERIEKEHKELIPDDKWDEFCKHLEILSPENIASIATGRVPSDTRYKFLSNIISGTFDIDRMDYLRRDAYYTGVETGNIDIWEIIQSYILAQEHDGVWMAALSTDAAPAVEVMLTVRDLSYRKVYYHPIHRSAQEMMIRAMCELIEDHPLSELLLLTDEELINVFEEKGNALSKDVAQRIKFRHIYHPLPIKINVSEDLCEVSQSKWAELTFKIPFRRDEIINEWLDAEKELSKKLNLPNEECIIFDLRRVPVTLSKECDGKNFYDESSKEFFSLLELLPHLKIAHGTTEQYIKDISNILITLPYEYINNVINTHHKKIENFDDMYSKHFITIIEDFIKFLHVTDEKADKLKYKFEDSMKRYIEEIIKEKEYLN